MKLQRKNFNVARRARVLPATGKVLPDPGFNLVQAGKEAFTLIELLLVIGIIAIISSLVAPVFRSWNSGDSIAAANRQLMDDFGMARNLALSTRSTVYVLFVPPNISGFTYGVLGTNDGILYTNLLGKPYTTYALYADRSIGDQPGAKHPRYLTEWRSLPERTFILTNDFFTGDLGFGTNLIFQRFPFPSASSETKVLPFIAFNSNGQLVPPASAGVARDLLIHVTSGTVAAARDRVTGTFLPQPVVAMESPENFSLFSSNSIHLNWLTGRGNVQRLEVGSMTSGAGTGAKK